MRERERDKKMNFVRTKIISSKLKLIITEVPPRMFTHDVVYTIDGVGCDMIPSEPYSKGLPRQIISVYSEQRNRPQSHRSLLLHLTKQFYPVQRAIAYLPRNTCFQHRLLPPETYAPINAVVFRICTRYGYLQNNPRRGFIISFFQL